MSQFFCTYVGKIILNLKFMHDQLNTPSEDKPKDLPDDSSLIDL